MERPFRYIREDFFLGGSFRNLDDLNVQLRHWLDTVANARVHATTQRVVNEAFAEEKPALKPLPLAPYRAVLKLERRVSHEGMVSVGGNLYSVPDTTRRRILDVHVFADEIRIFENGADRQPSRRSKGATRRVSTRLIGRLRRRRADGRPMASPSSSAAPATRSPAARSTSTKPSADASPAREARNDRHAEIVPSVVDRIKQTLVGLKMPRAIEILDATVRRLERGEMTALEAIDALLAEELTLRENRRIKTALVMARLSTIKTLAGFDFSFQPSLDKNRIMALAELKFIDRAEVLHLVGPPGTGKSHLSLALGVEAVKAGRSVYFTTLADLVGALAKAEREGSSAREDQVLLPLRPAHRRRDRLPAGHSRRRQSVLPARQRPLRKGRHDPHLQSRLCRMGRGFRRSRRRHGPPDRLLHHAIVIQIEGSSYRLRQHADLVPEHIRSKALIQPPPIPPQPKRRGRPPKNGGLDHHQRLITSPPKWGILLAQNWGDSARH